MACVKGFLAIWLFVWGLLLLAKKFQPAPIEIVSKMVTLLGPIVNLSFLRPHADCIFVTLGIGYIVSAVEIIHSTCCGRCLTVLLSVISCLIPDNPLFLAPKGSEKYIMMIAHILVIGAVLALGEVSPVLVGIKPIAPAEKKEIIKKIVKEEEEEVTSEKKKKAHKKTK